MCVYVLVCVCILYLYIYIYIYILIYNQFGFKCGVGCPDAIFALKSVINHFVYRGSFSFIASLDASKAFDRVNHFKLFNYVLDAAVSFVVV